MRINHKNILKEGKVVNNGRDIMWSGKIGAGQTFNNEELIKLLQDKLEQDRIVNIVHRVDELHGDDSIHRISEQRLDIDNIKYFEYDFGQRILISGKKYHNVDLEGFQLKIIFENTSLDHAWTDIFIKREFENIRIEYHIVIKNIFSDE